MLDSWRSPSKCDHPPTKPDEFHIARRKGHTCRAVS
jgi:hypothetical protein